MRARSATAAALALILAAFVTLPALAQGTGKLYVHPQGSAYFPLDTYTNSISGASESLYSPVGYGGGIDFDYALTPFLQPFFRLGAASVPYSGSAGTALVGVDGKLGVGFVFRPVDRLALRLDAAGGLAEIYVAGKDVGMAFAASARLGLEYRVSPAISLSLHGGYATYFGTSAQILSAVEAGLYLSYDLSAIGGAKAKVRVEDPKLDAVFPSLYAYYDDNAFGTVKVVNGEDSGITGVSVAFNAGHYMDQPKVCGEYASLAKGASVTVPVKALFTDSVLQITQGTDAKGEIIVKYEVLGSERVVRAPIDFRMHHRNAITWSDDKRAASFVSVTNPAALWFSKFASGVARERLRGDINQPLQFAIAMFEAERLYGLNYVVVPANDYSVKHGLKDYVDSVQFPHQTLSNRGGDCSDLAVLFSALMQSVGVDTAFITIPGHIFSAFDTGLTEEQAQASFYDTGLLIYRDGKAWVPVEITMVKDGFIKAWRVAAKEWYDSVKKGSAAFYTLPDCWKTYPPAAFPGVNPRFALPPESDEAVAFDAALDRFVAREIEPSLKALESELASSPKEVRENEIGVLYANYGMLKESWAKLSSSAKAGCQQAWTNLANVAYLRKDYKLALSYYQWAYSLSAEDDNALLGMARCQYELEDFDSADAAYALLSERNPSLASRFGYLGSVFGGQGRAWSLADRAATTAWRSARGSSSSAAFVMPSTAAPKKQAAPAPAVAKPVVAAEAPVDPNAIASPAEAAAQARASALDAQVAAKPAAAPTAPPKVETAVPDGAKEAAAKEAAAEAAALAEQKRQAELAEQKRLAALAEQKRQADVAAKEAAAKAAAEAAALAEQKRQAELAAKEAAAKDAAAKAEAVAMAEQKRQAELAAKEAAAKAAAAKDTAAKEAAAKEVAAMEAASKEAAARDAAAKEAAAKAELAAKDAADKEAAAKAAAEAATRAEQKRLADLAEQQRLADIAAKEAAAKAAAEAAALAEQKRQADIAEQKRKDELAAKSAALLAANAKAVAPPTLAAEAPKDQDLAAKAAEEKRVKQASETPEAKRAREEAEAAAAAAAKKAADEKRAKDAAALLAASAKSSAPPTLAAEAPKDQDIAAKAAEEKRVKQASETPEAKRAREEAEAAAALAAKKAADEKRAKEAADAAALAQAEAAAREAASAAAAAQAAAVPAPQAARATLAAEPVAAPALAAEPQEAAPKPLGDSDLPATIDTEILLSGFEGAAPMVGSWTIDGEVASQTDGDAFYAKLGSPLIQDSRAFKYSFTAKSTAPGRGWVGIGFHAYVPKSYTVKGYGAGDSICLWLTRDPVHYKKDVTRLQLYRSVDDWDMNLIAEIAVPESIYEANSFELEIDPATGVISASLNGTKRLEVKDVIDLHKGICVAFRALDTAEFSAFKVEALK
jgi:hypothetical protein